MHELRAEYDPAVSSADHARCPSLVWHIIAKEAATMCGRLLHTSCAAPVSAPQEPGDERYCMPCMDAYRQDQEASAAGGPAVGLASPVRRSAAAGVSEAVRPGDSLGNRDARVPNGSAG
ncbi:hypothetical protein [Streptacidiphilus sp. PAMC 29251]